MPNREAHLLAGVALGLSAGIPWLDDIPGSWGRFVFLSGTAIGGGRGGLQPDIFEPSKGNPRHRKMAHSVVFAGVPTVVGIPTGILAAEWLKDKAAQALVRWEASGRSDWFSGLIRFICLFLAGFVVSFPWGYASHLCLDARTKQSLPFLGLK